MYGRRPGKELVIGRDQKSPVAVSVLSLGLLLPFGAGAFSDRAIAIMQDVAAQTPAKHIIFIQGTAREDVTSRASTIGGFLAERGIDRQPDDRISSAPDTALSDGATVAYRPAVNVAVVVDGVVRHVRSAAATVGELLAEQRLSPAPHDRVTPAAASALTADATVELTRTTSWLEKVLTRIAPPLTRKYDLSMKPGTQRIIDAGSPGTKETTVAVLQPTLAAAPRRMFLAERVLRLPRTRIVAQGVEDHIAFGDIARRGFVGTMRLADAALRMVATAYTAACSGCSGMTATGRAAGHGVVAVDPRVIPLGTHLFIPGYGHAFAGDTGGAIHGNRIDLGFDSNRDALSFGRRPIVVYVLK